MKVRRSDDERLQGVLRAIAMIQKYLAEDRAQYEAE
jgi:hypothetical protein